MPDLRSNSSSRSAGFCNLDYTGALHLLCCYRPTMRLFLLAILLVVQTWALPAGLLSRGPRCESRYSFAPVVRHSAPRDLSVWKYVAVEVATGANISAEQKYLAVVEKRSPSTPTITHVRRRQLRTPVKRAPQWPRPWPTQPWPTQWPTHTTCTGWPTQTVI